jgi:hypothetical protein
MRIHLFYDNGMDTGETFATWAEVEQWYHEQMGHWPKTADKAAIKSERSFAVGSRYYKCEKVKSHSLTAVA